MKKISASLLAAAVVAMGLTMTTVLPAEANPAYQNNVVTSVTVTTETKAQVNWEKGAAADITVVGVGLPPQNLTPLRGRILAKRAAIVDGYRLMAETLNGVQVDAETTVQDMSLASDTVNVKVQALIKGAKIVKEEYLADGSCMVTMSVPLYGVSGVAGVALQSAPLATIPSYPTVSPTYKPTGYAQGYTSVIIDADNMGLEGTFSPVIYDTEGRVIYGMRNLDKDFAISQGMVEYAGDVAQAYGASRAGARPLVVKAVAVRGGKNSVNPVNVVVSVEDGEKILYAHQESRMLDQRAVVFVK